MNAKLHDISELDKQYADKNTFRAIVCDRLTLSSLE